MQTNVQVFDTEVGYNIATLEGAILHILQIFGCLSVESLDKFARIYALQRGKVFKSKNDVSKWLLPMMRRKRCIWQLGGDRFYTINPILKPDRLKQDAFWVFLEFMEDIPLQSVGQGPTPAQLSYFRRERDYHIIAVRDNGERELKQALSYEAMIQNARKSFDTKSGDSKKVQYPEERFIVLFRSEDLMRNAAYNLNSKTMYGVVTYPQGSNIPNIKFYSPDKL